MARTKARPRTRRFSPAEPSVARDEMEVQVARRAGDPNPGWDTAPNLIRLTGGDPSRQLEAITANTTVVVADHVLWDEAWTADHLTELAKAIYPDRWLVFLEPVADLGWRAWAARLLAGRDRARHDHAFTRDVPQDLRRAGLVVTTTVRFDVGRRLTYAWGEARHFPGLDGDGHGTPQR